MMDRFFRGNAYQSKRELFVFIKMVAGFAGDERNCLRRSINHVPHTDDVTILRRHTASWLLSQLRYGSNGSNWQVCEDQHRGKELPTILVGCPQTKIPECGLLRTRRVCPNHWWGYHPHAELNRRARAA